MNTPIQYYIKSNYGTDLMYFAEATIGDRLRVKAIQGLTNSKTLRPQDKIHLENLGFTFVQVLTPRR